MAKVNTSYSDRRPSLYPENVKGAPDAMVCTVMSAELYRRGTLAGVEFYEYPGYVVWARAAELKALASELGDDTDDWPHRRVVLEKVTRNNPRTGGTVEKYVVAPAAEWANLAEVTAKPKAERAGRTLRPRTDDGVGRDAH